MKKDWKYIVYLSVFIGIYVSVQLLSPKRHDWSITLSHVDKDPYGTYVLSELLPNLFDSIGHSNKTLYELLNKQKNDAAMLILATSITMGKEDTDKLLEYASRGNTVFLSAHYFNGHLADTLNLSTIDFLFDGNNSISQSDSVSLHFSNSAFDTLALYQYKRDNAHNYFNAYDTLKTAVIGKNDMDEPITIKISIGKGALILNSTPLAFTNINVLAHENAQFVSQTLSYLNQQKLIWTEFYHLGRMEASTPLRFILTQESLSWAYYIIIGSILLLILFESKRKQRVIPIIPALQNTSLEFVSTIGNLYYQRGDHKNIAEKKIAFFYETLRSRYNLETGGLTDQLHIAKKTGNDEASTSALFNLINEIFSKPSITSDELIKLNKRIEAFLK